MKLPPRPVPLSHRTRSRPPRALRRPATSTSSTRAPPRASNHTDLSGVQGSHHSSPRTLCSSTGTSPRPITTSVTIGRRTSAPSGTSRPPCSTRSCCEWPRIEPSLTNHPRTHQNTHATPDRPQVRHRAEGANGLRQFAAADRTQRPPKPSPRRPTHPRALCERAEAVEECKHRMSRYGVTCVFEIKHRTQPLLPRSTQKLTSTFCLRRPNMLVLPPQEIFAH